MAKTSLPKTNSEIKTCSIAGCGQRSVARGWCPRHWTRWKRHGSPDGRKPVRKDCSVEGCEALAIARGWCHNHYRRWSSNKSGDPSIRRSSSNDPRPDDVRFHEKVARTEDDQECWPWTGYCDERGYGRFGMQGRQFAAHRVALYFMTGEMPSRCVLHSCDNPPCCNPSHLREGTHKDNYDDMISRNRAGWQKDPNWGKNRGKRKSK